MTIKEYETYRINDSLHCVIIDSKNDINGNTRFKYLVVYNKYLEDSVTSSTESFSFWSYGFNGYQDLKEKVMNAFCKFYNISFDCYREAYIIANCDLITEWYEGGNRNFKFIIKMNIENNSCHYIVNRGWVN